MKLHKGLTDTEALKESDNSSEIVDQETDIKIEEIATNIMTPALEELEIGIYL